MVNPTVTPPIHPGAGTLRRESAAEGIDSGLATAFYPFAKLSLSETRRQVEASAEYNEKQALRKEEEAEAQRVADSDTAPEVRTPADGLVQARQGTSPEEPAANTAPESPEPLPDPEEQSQVIDVLA